MRKLFLDELPKININNYIDWSMSVGHVIKFEYDDIVGEFEIIEYDIEKNELSLGYLGEIHKISTSTFKRVGLRKILAWLITTDGQ